MEGIVELCTEGFSQSEFEDVKQCLETLFSIRAGSQPMDRMFGINLDEVTGYPIPVAKNILSLEIIEKVRKYEPRVEIAHIEFDCMEDGQLVPKIQFNKAKDGQKIWE